MNLTLCGGGSWGTAIARLLSNKGHKVNFYIRNEQVIEDIKKNKENSKYLSEDFDPDTELEKGKKKNI